MPASSTPHATTIKSFALLSSLDGAKADYSTFETFKDLLFNPKKSGLPNAIPKLVFSF